MNEPKNHDTAMPSEMAVCARDLHKSFDRGIVKALDGLDLTIGTNEYVAITGPSGCGKSTLLHLLAALDHPDSGELEVDGEDLIDLRQPNHFRRERIGLVFQLHNLLPHLDAKSNIGVAMLGTSRSRHERSERADDLLEMVGLGGLGHRRPPELSGGERQRVAIARALANEPAVLLADEPTGSLDSKAVELVLGLLEDLRTQRAVTVVMVTHDMAIAGTADRIVYLLDGKVVDRSQE